METASKEKIRAAFADPEAQERKRIADMSYDELKQEQKAKNEETKKKVDRGKRQREHNEALIAVAQAEIQKLEDERRKLEEKQRKEIEKAEKKPATKDEQKQQRMQEILMHCLAPLKDSLENTPVDLSDVTAVNNVISGYVMDCVEHVMIPSMSGLALALRTKESALTDWMMNHAETETGISLLTAREAFLAVNMQASLQSTTSAIPSIFGMKAQYGVQEGNAQQAGINAQKDRARAASAEEIKKKYKDLLEE